MYDPNENRFGDPEDQFTRPPRKAASNMALAAVACAIIGILSVFTVIGGMFFGSLAILFARLSQSDRTEPERPAKYALRVGIVALVISGAIMLFSLTFVIHRYGGLENFYQEYMEMIEQQYELYPDHNLPAFDSSPNAFGNDEML